MYTVTRFLFVGSGLVEKNNFLMTRMSLTSSIGGAIAIVSIKNNLLIDTFLDNPCITHNVSHLL